MYSVFISYAHKDSEFVLQFVGTLKENGVRIWIDQDELHPGVNWAVAVGDALKNCTHVVVFVTHSSMESSNVHDEINYARDNDKIIIPVLIDDVNHVRLSSLQHIKYQGDFDGLLTQVLKILPKDPVVQQSEGTQDHTLENSFDSEMLPPQPDFDGITITRRLSYSGLSIIYYAENEKRERFLFKQRYKKNYQEIDYTEIRLDTNRFAVPKQIAEDDQFVYEVIPYHEGWSLAEIIALNSGGVRGNLLEMWTRSLLELINDLQRHTPPIIHRDIKPENILLKTDKHSFVILDLDSVVFYDPAKTYTSLGTDGYMSPEQKAGNPTLASDLYSLAATIYKLNTGYNPSNSYEREMGDKKFALQQITYSLAAIYPLMANVSVYDRAPNAETLLQRLNDIPRRTDNSWVKTRKGEREGKTPNAPSSSKLISKLTIKLIDSGREFDFRADTISNLVIGRVDTSTSYRPDIDLLEFDGDKKGVSRRHVMIQRSSNNRHLYITDMKSRNGTWLNGRRIGSHQQKGLKSGDQIALGSFKLQVFLAYADQDEGQKKKPRISLGATQQIDYSDPEHGELNISTIVTGNVVDVAHILKEIAIEENQEGGDLMFPDDTTLNQGYTDGSSVTV